MNVIKIQVEQRGQYDTPVVYVDIKKPKELCKKRFNYRDVPVVESKELYEMMEDTDSRYEKSVDPVYYMRQGHIHIHFADHKEFMVHAWSTPSQNYKFDMSTT